MRFLRYTGKASEKTPHPPLIQVVDGDFDTLTPGHPLPVIDPSVASHTLKQRPLLGQYMHSKDKDVPPHLWVSSHQKHQARARNHYYPPYTRR